MWYSKDEFDITIGLFYRMNMWIVFIVSGKYSFSHHCDIGLKVFAKQNT